MSQEPLNPTLYGLTNSNRSGADLWGKNQFNSTFPAALACYMRDQGIPAVYLELAEDLTVATRDISIGEVFNSDLPNSLLQFDFETSYEPYKEHALDEIGGIDLVIRHHGDSTRSGWRRPLEVKLTVVPDDSTSKQPEDEWGPELVIRGASTRYCALGIYDSCKDRKGEIREIFQAVCGNFEHWESQDELKNKRGQLLVALDKFQSAFRCAQKPFLLQPIWKTEGKSSFLGRQAFDLFVWSDFALCRSFIRDLEGEGKITRPVRAAARLARALYALATQERVNLGQIYSNMTYGLLNDKEFALGGRITRGYLNSPRRVDPALPREILAEIILGGGERLLSPERRFDATIFFAARTAVEAKVDVEE